ncbi:hypothetical protein GMMP15_720039 [Candidatus Magnetomoraceae bacterium gMMP-15]
MKKFFAVFIALLSYLNVFIIISYAAGPDPVPVHFTGFKKTPSSCFYVGKAININGVDAVDGEDEVGVFWNDGSNEILVGAVIKGSPSSPIDDHYYVTVYGDDPSSTNEKDGPTDGDELIFKIWDKSEEQEYNIATENMTTESSQGLESPSVPPVFKDKKIFGLLHLGKSNSFNINLTAGWNLISLPVTPDDCGLSTLFPDAEVAYAFQDGAYVTVNNLEPGKGYWIKVPSDKIYILTGQNFMNYTISLSPGWHLLGAVNTSASPSGEIEVIYKYDNGAYDDVNKLNPGYGYWVKITQQCDFQLGDE